MYSVEMDDFLSLLLEPGQMFGSMNMDEFLANNLTSAIMEGATESGEVGPADDQGNVAPENGGGGLGSMNMDEFLANNLTSAIMEGATESGEGGPADDQGNVAPENGGGGALIGEPSLVDESYPSIPPTMSRRTMDEVWTDINRNQSLPPSGSGSQRNPDILSSYRFPDALVNAFKQGQALTQDQAHHQAQQQQQQPSGHGLQVQQQQAQAQQAHHQAGHLLQQQQSQAQQAHAQADLLQAQAHAANGMYNRAGNRGQMPNMNSNGEYMGMASTSAPQLGQMGVQFNVLALPAQSPASKAGVKGHGNGLSQMLPVGTYGVDGSMGGRTRGADPERVERRQRRMRKNRDSAEKSRARKQAHDAELEAEVSQLEEENDRLKKEKEKRAKYIEWLNLESTKSRLQSDSRKNLLRTSSAPF